MKNKTCLVRVGNVEFGGDQFVIVAGPCAVESEEQTLRIAKEIQKRGGQILRGGAYKPRTSPYSFQGLGIEGLKILKTAREETGLPVVTEAVDIYSLEQVAIYSDMIQIGARNMHNQIFLKEVSRLKHPVLLKRSMAATLDEWLEAAEILLENGNDQVVLCERGIRTFESHSRNTLDLTAVPMVKSLCPLPVIVDPSHGTGRRELVSPLAKASLAVGAHGMMVDVHDRPQEALCDGPQALLPSEFSDLVMHLRRVEEVMYNT